MNEVGAAILSALYLRNKLNRSGVRNAKSHALTQVANSIPLLTGQITKNMPGLGQKMTMSAAYKLRTIFLSDAHPVERDLKHAV